MEQPEPTADDANPRALGALAPRSARRRLLAVLFGLTVTFGGLELGLRLATTDVRDRQTLFGVDLLPAAPPPLRTGSEQYIRYDADCGWVPMPFGSSAQNQYFADQFGLRAPAAEERTPPADSVPVMLCGDSFAHSDEVSYDESLGVAIERTRPGTWVQIAGVPAYGLDQALLRYRKLAPRLRPRIVVIGSHQNDFMRSVALWTRSGFSKPRFVFADDGSLELVNRPALGNAAFVAQFDDFDDTLFARHQFFHQPGIYEPRATDGIRTLRYLRSLIVKRDRDSRYQETVRKGCRNEVHQIARAVVGQFAREVIADGGVPIVLTLPSSAHLEYLRHDNDWWSWALAGAAEDAGCEYVDVTPALRADVDEGRTPIGEVFTRDGYGHLTAAGNRRVAELLLPALERAVESLESQR